MPIESEGQPFELPTVPESAVQPETALLSDRGKPGGNPLSLVAVGEMPSCDWLPESLAIRQVNFKLWCMCRNRCDPHFSRDRLTRPASLASLSPYLARLALKVAG